jgi:hypothetical protein
LGSRYAVFVSAKKAGDGFGGRGTGCWVWLRERKGTPFRWKVLLQVRLSAR